MQLNSQYPRSVFNIAAYGGYTFFARTKYLEAGASISALGLYSTQSLSAKYKIALRNSAGSYTVVKDLASYSHGGTGWEDQTVSPAYVVPSNGNYVVGAYCSTALKGYGGSNYGDRAFILGDQTGTNTGYTEDVHNAGCVRYTVSGISGSVNSETCTLGDVTTNVAGYTIVDYSYSFNGVILSAIGVKSSISRTYVVKLLKYNSATNLDVVVSESYSHGGTGIEYHTLSSPYSVPTTGTYCLGLYCASTQAAQGGTQNRGYYSGDATGTGVGFTNDNQIVPVMAASIAPISSFQAAWATKHNQMIGAGVF